MKYLEVIDVRDNPVGYGKRGVEALGMRYINIAMSDPRYPGEAQIAEFLKTVGGQATGAPAQANQARVLWSCLPHWERIPDGRYARLKPERLAEKLLAIHIRGLPSFLDSIPKFELNCGYGVAFAD